MAIISFQHRVIFIKTTKTGGTSIEIDLARHLGPDAVVTPIIPPVAGHEPRNYTAANGEARYYNHMTAAEIRDRLGEEAFASFYRFTVEREPVDKCLSHFHMRKNRDDEHGLAPAEREALTWEAYVDSGQFPLDLAKYRDPTHPDQLLVDEVLAYETLHQTLPARLEARGIFGFELKSTAKSEYRRRPHVTLDDVTDLQKDKIYSAFSQTIEMTGLYR